ncbi:MAG: hypothetical protein Q8L55_15330, partial [Phycisphaerales bacterium]|nr:hypothetical protein [Phycisphaerales bacterium]
MSPSARRRLDASRLTRPHASCRPPSSPRALTALAVAAVVLTCAASRTRADTWVFDSQTGLVKRDGAIVIDFNGAPIVNAPGGDGVTAWAILGSVSLGSIDKIKFTGTSLARLHIAGNLTLAGGAEISANAEDRSGVCGGGDGAEGGGGGNGGDGGTGFGSPGGGGTPIPGAPGQAGSGQAGGIGGQVPRMGGNGGNGQLATGQGGGSGLSRGIGGNGDGGMIGGDGGTGSPGLNSGATPGAPG